MAQRRMISKSISVSRKLAKVKPFTALVFTWLIPHCDDGGNMAGDPETVKALVIPARPETVGQTEIAIEELKEIGLIDPYEADGESYIHIMQWSSHQTLRLDRATWQYPRYSKDNQSATTRQSTVAEVAAEGKVSKGKVSKDKSTLTPREQTEAFFEAVTKSSTKMNDFVVNLAKQNNQNKAQVFNEIVKFTSYWTEPNHTGKKQRWEMQATFDVRRRLTTWFSRAGFQGFSTQKSSKGKNIIF